VLFTEPAKRLQRTAAPPAATEEGLASRVKNVLRTKREHPTVYAPLALSFLPFLSIPEGSVEAFRELLVTEDENEDEENAYDEFRSGHPVKGSGHQFLGWPSPIQGEMELECQLAANGIYVGNAEGYEDSRAEELGVGAKDWMLLLQVDSDDDAEMMWGDAGMLYYWIRREDLEQRRFHKAWLVLQCF
jgi:hypothetical protein